MIPESPAFDIPRKTCSGDTPPPVRLRNRYHCKHCGKTILRDSNKQWVKSFCEKTGKNTHLHLIKSHSTTS